MEYKREVIMPTISFTGLLIVVAVAFLAPLLLGLSPLRRLPAVVLEILGGIIIGPSVLRWVRVDQPISILALLGLAFLLFLAGLEVELERLRGRLLTYVALAFLISLGLALLAGYAFYVAGQVVSPLLIAIILVATALGIVVPILKDAGESETGFGQLVIAGAMFAEFGSIILLSLFFSHEATSTGAKFVLLGGFVLVAIMCVFVVLRVERSPRLAAVLVRLQDTTAQIRVRGAFALLVAFAALSEVLGLETILGAFIAGVILRQIDGDRMLTHPHFRQKLEAIGFGVFIPTFFITSGIQFDLKALLASTDTILRVPLFLLALLLIRGLPALLYRPLVGPPRSIVAGLLQATSLSFIVAASQIGLDLGLLTKANVAALIAAGVLSVIIFPIIALTLLRQRAPELNPV
ncbi:sodium:proton antiporter [Dictyobacter sp. S3.2.2.5]|uniref:Sodium:proton antiporter n=1 Tax=Dictyobacter halimunensis TaxID=3026934 RepID=A0ABQ6FLX6_9CHLR|nr:sodium:proton antiporter [Dictyobacter sp. S3.2.2.5]